MIRSFVSIALVTLFACIPLQLWDCRCVFAKTSDEPTASMQLLWIDTFSECASETVYTNIIVEVDDLPIAFQRAAISEHTELQHNASLTRMLTTRQADVALWYDCNDTELHIFSLLLVPKHQSRKIALNDTGEAPIESITAIVRCWLEGVLPLWRKAQRDRSLTKAETQNSPGEDDRPADGPEAQRDSAPKNHSAFGAFETASPSSNIPASDTPRTTTNSEKRTVGPSIIRPEIGVLVSSPGENRLIPGVYGTIAVHLSQHIRVGLFGALMKSVTIRESGVKTILNQYPLSIFASGLFSLEGTRVETRLGFELSPIKRKVIVDSDSTYVTWKQQPAMVGLMGFILPVGQRLFWIFDIGARVVLFNTVLQIEEGDSPVTIQDPWRVQPIVFTGIQVGLF